LAFVLGFGTWLSLIEEQVYGIGEGLPSFEALDSVPRPDNDFPAVFPEKGLRLRAIFLLPVRVFHVELRHNIYRHGFLLLSRLNFCKLD